MFALCPLHISIRMTTLMNYQKSIFPWQSIIILTAYTRPVTNTYFTIRIFDHKTIWIIRIFEYLKLGQKHTMISSRWYHACILNHVSHFTLTCYNFFYRKYNWKNRCWFPITHINDNSLPNFSSWNTVGLHTLSVKRNLSLLQGGRSLKSTLSKVIILGHKF